MGSRVRRVRPAALVALVAVVVVAHAAADPRIVELAVKNGQLPEDRRVVRVQQGDEVTLSWTTDRPLTLHLHGYDLEAKLAPGPPVTMRLRARATGRFPIEIHSAGGAHHVLGYLEVHPR